MLIAELIGNLGVDAEIIGNDYIRLRVAHSEKKRVEGELIESTTWINVSCQMRIQKLLPYLKRGTKVYVRGPISARAYLDAHATPSAGMNMFCDYVEILYSPREQQASAEAQAQPQANADDLPF